MQEDFFITYFTSHLYLYVSKGLFQVCMWERAGDRTLLKYFDPKVMAVSVVSFSFFMAAQPEPGVNSSVCWLSLLHRVYLCLPLYCLPSFSPISNCPQFVGLILPSNSHAVIQTRLNACATSSDFQRPGCVTSFRGTTLNGIFGRVKRSKHNTSLTSELSLFSGSDYHQFPCHHHHLWIS